MQVSPRLPTWLNGNRPTPSLTHTNRYVQQELSSPGERKLFKAVRLPSRHRVARLRECRGGPTCESIFRLTSTLAAPLP